MELFNEQQVDDVTRHMAKEILEHLLGFTASVERINRLCFYLNAFERQEQYHCKQHKIYLMDNVRTERYCGLVS